MLRKPFAAALVFLLCIAPLWAQDRRNEPPVRRDEPARRRDEPVKRQAEPVKRRAVRVEQAGRRVLLETISTSGTAGAARLSKLNFRVGGNVSEMLVEMGQRVSKGQPLAKLDDANYKLYVEQAQASLDAATAAYEKVKAGFRPEEIAQAEAGVQAAQAALEKFTTGFRAEDIKAAEAGLVAAQAGFEQAKRNFERMKKLYEEKKAVAQATYEQAKTQYEVARAQRDQAQQHLKTLRTGYEQADVESMRARFKQAAEQLTLLKKGFRAEDVKAAKAQVALAQAALKLAQKSLQDTVLRAPYDGVVVDTFVDPGDSVVIMPGQVAVAMMDISSLEVTVPIPDVWAGVVNKKAGAIVDLDGGPKGLDAKVAAISDAIDPLSRAFSVKLVLANPGLTLKAGMFARVRIVYNRVVALAVPSTAVLEDATGGRYVMVNDAGVAARMTVKTGITSDGYTQVSGKIAEGQEIIFEGNFGLRVGAKIELVKETGKNDK